MALQHSSLFSQLLGVIERHFFERCVRETAAEKGAKGFTCWEQLVAMLFCQLAQARSLREIVGGLQCCEALLSKINLREPPRAGHNEGDENKTTHHTEVHPWLYSIAASLASFLA